MDFSFPQSFIGLKAARDKPRNSVVNVIGAVVDFLPPAKSRNDWFVTFKLLDLELRNDGTDNQGLLVRFFHEREDGLPSIQQLGEIVLIRAIKRIDFAGMPHLLSNFGTSIVIFPPATIPKAAFAGLYGGNNRFPARGDRVERVDADERKYVIRLHHKIKDHVSALPSPGAPANQTRPSNGFPTGPSKPQEPVSAYFGAKFKLVKDVGHKQYADVLVQVVKKYEAHNKVELYVTDYTENKNVWLYLPPEEESEKDRMYDGDPYNYTNISKKEWKGPWGQRVLKVNAMEPHATFARAEVTEGQTVVLKNMKVKAMEGAKLEGDLWPDDKSPDRICIRPLPQAGQQSPEFTALQLRKEQYWTERKKMEAEIARKLEAVELLDISNLQESGPPIEKTAEQRKAEKKKEKRKRRNQRELEKQLLQDEAVQNNGAPPATITPTHQDEAVENNGAPLATYSAANQAEAVQNQGAPLVTYSAGNDCNKHIRAINPNQRIMNVRDILDPDDVRHWFLDDDGSKHHAPFVNLNYKAKVHVVGYEPADIRDFAQIEWPDEDDNRPLPADYDYGPNPNYEWYFALICEDATTPLAIKTHRERITIHVRHEDAQHLLGNDMPEPKNLWDNPKMLAKLKEKLCILWGNLEEKAEDEPLVNLPFLCIVQEWGVEMEEFDDKSHLEERDLGWERCYGLHGTTIL